MKKPTKKAAPPTFPLISALPHMERAYLLAILGAYPVPSATAAAGIRDPTLARGRAQVMLQSQQLLQAIMIVLGPDVVITLCQQVGIDPPQLAPISGFTNTANLLDGSTSIADADARKRFWTALMKDPDASPGDRLKASDLLAKAEGDYKAPDEKGSTSDSLTEMLLRIEEREAQTRKTSLPRKEALVQAGAVPKGIDLNNLELQLHSEWFHLDGTPRVDRPRRRVLIETIPAAVAGSSEATNGTDGQGSVDQKGKPPVPSLAHHMRGSRPKPGATLAEAYQLPESTF